MTRTTWRERWNPPGRGHDGKVKSPEYRNAIRTHESLAPPPRESDVALAEIIKELLLIGQGGDLDAIVRAYEITNSLQSRMLLPPGTWAIVKHYSELGALPRIQGNATGFAFHTEAQCREFAAVEHEFCAARSERNRWTKDTFKAEQVDNAVPSMLIREDVTAEAFHKWLVRTLS